ncbi:MAG: undecaprenyl-diphosphate phosphatase [Clostridia bacterium]|nr:undecaprenyl-diphosphate phosphatase [Clostridia bacterium]
MIVLGVVQGITEFLPISSSGHLVLLQKVFGMRETGLLLEILLHVGSLIAVFAVFFKDFWMMLVHPVRMRAVRLLIIATIPTVLVTVLLRSVLEAAFGGWFLGISFLITSAILLLSDFLAARANANGIHRNDSVETLRYRQALLVGGAQAAAIVPGISRSGATIVCGLAAGITRQTAAKFSFLMSAVASVGSLVFKLRDLAGADSAAFEGGWLAMIAAMAAAAIVGYMAIRWMLRLIINTSLKWFGLYTGLIGAIILCDQLFFGVVFEKIFR